MKYTYIGENIRIYRERAQLTQQQLADKVGVSWEMISRYERSESSPYKKLDSISEALNVAKSQLVEKHIPQQINSIEYRIPLFLNIPCTNKFDSNQTNYYYVCPEWIIKRDMKSFAIDTSLVISQSFDLQRNGILYISMKCTPKSDDLVLVREQACLVVQRYKENMKTKVLGKVLAQEIRY